MSKRRHWFAKLVWGEDTHAHLLMGCSFSFLIIGRAFSVAAPVQGNVSVFSPQRRFHLIPGLLSDTDKTFLLHQTFENKVLSTEITLQEGPTSIRPSGNVAKVP